MAKGPIRKKVYIDNRTGRSEVTVGGEKLPVLQGVHTLDEYEALYEGKLPTGHTALSVLQHAQGQLRAKADANTATAEIVIWAEEDAPPEVVSKVADAEAALEAALQDAGYEEVEEEVEEEEENPEAPGTKRKVKKTVKVRRPKKTVKKK